MVNEVCFLGSSERDHFYHCFKVMYTFILKILTSVGKIGILKIV